MAMPEQKPATGTATVVVACKLSAGMICDIFAPRKTTEVTLGGSREVTQYFETGQRFKINGPGHPQNEGPRCQVASGFAITRGVPKHLWDLWLEQNKTLPAVVGGMIFAYDSTDRAVDAARERKAIKTGLERVDPNNLPKLDPRLRLKTADEQRAKIAIRDDAE